MTWPFMAYTSVILLLTNWDDPPRTTSGNPCCWGCWYIQHSALLAMVKIQYILRIIVWSYLTYSMYLNGWSIYLILVSFYTNMWVNIPYIECLAYVLFINVCSPKRSDPKASNHFQDSKDPRFANLLRNMSSTKFFSTHIWRIPWDPGRLYFAGKKQNSQSYGIPWVIRVI